MSTVNVSKEHVLLVPIWKRQTGTRDCLTGDRTSTSYAHYLLGSAVLWSGLNLTVVFSGLSHAALS
jgi:hypothetical protein